MIRLYETLMSAGAPLLSLLLRYRAGRGKEDPERIGERKGQPSRLRPSGKMVWIHAASVGESQSALILIDALLLRDPHLHILVTTGTVTSAKMMNARLPVRAFHQFFPLDRSAWVRAFLDHWQPDLVLWMESELWPCMLREIRRRNIPAALVNARLSMRSFRRWKRMRTSIAAILDSFGTILTQTETGKTYFEALGGKNVHATGNLKYSAKPLPADQDALASLQGQTENRPLWLYASTHEGEETLAFRLHRRLKDFTPRLLTLIVPRHPARAAGILKAAQESGLRTRLRSASPVIEAGDDVYIADTLGELGLFYRLCPLACIGRSFSADGGGGHNPIEAAQLGCAVLHGPDVQNLSDIYQDMDEAGASLPIHDEDDFARRLQHFLHNPEELRAFQQRALAFMTGKGHIIDTVMMRLDPLLTSLMVSGWRACA